MSVVKLGGKRYDHVRTRPKSRIRAVAGGQSSPLQQEFISFAWMGNVRPALRVLLLYITGPREELQEWSPAQPRLASHWFSLFSSALSLREPCPEAPSSSGLLVTAGTTPPAGGDSKALGEDAAPDISDSMPVSRLAGLRGRFSSWRRKRKSIPTVAVAEEDDEDGDVENAVDSKETNAAALSSKPAVSQEARGEIAPAAQAEFKITARRSDTGAKPLGEEEVGVRATAKPPIAENVLAADGKVAAGEVFLPVAELVTGGGAEASSEENVSLAPVGTLAVSVASEDRGPVKGAAVPAAARPLRAAGSENESKETSADAEKRPVARVTAADPFDNLDLDQSAAAAAGDDEPSTGEIEVAGEQGQSQTASSFAESSSSGGASPGAGERAQTDAERAGGEGGDYTSEQIGSVAVMAPSKDVASAGTPRVDTDSNVEDALVGGPDVGTPTKNDRPSSTGNLGESAAAAAAANDAKESVNTSTVPTAAGSTATKQVAAEAAPLESGERSGPVVPSLSASSSSPVPADTGLSPPSPPPSPSRNEVSQKKEEGRGNLAAQKRFETPTKTEEREGMADEAGPTVSAGKRKGKGKGTPPVIPSKLVNNNNDDDELAAAAGEAVPRVAGKAGRVGIGSDTQEGSTSAWNAMNPAAEFLKDWVDKAVPQKKAELKRRESAVCWERQWCVTLGR